MTFVVATGSGAASGGAGILYGNSTTGTPYTPLSNLTLPSSPSSRRRTLHLVSVKKFSSRSRSNLPTTTTTDQEPQTTDPTTKVRYKVDDLPPFMGKLPGSDQNSFKAHSGTQLASSLNIFGFLAVFSRYCDCFAAGVYCIEPCSCQDCFNKPIHEDTFLQTHKQIESRNPLAFAPKVIRSSDSVPEIGDDPNKTPASARHKRGYNCKKSSCLKKYCECYQGGVGCPISCRCEGCKNAYGRKDGSAEAEAEEETETSDKGVVEKAIQKTEIQNIEDHPDSRKRLGR